MAYVFLHLKDEKKVHQKFKSVCFRVTVVLTGTQQQCRWQQLCSQEYDAFLCYVRLEVEIGQLPSQMLYIQMATATIQVMEFRKVERLELMQHYSVKKSNSLNFCAETPSYYWLFAFKLIMKILKLHTTTKFSPEGSVEIFSIGKYFVDMVRD